MNVVNSCFPYLSVSPVASLKPPVIIISSDTKLHLDFPPFLFLRVTHSKTFRGSRCSSVLFTWSNHTNYLFCNSSTISLPTPILPLNLEFGTPCIMMLMCRYIRPRWLKVMEALSVAALSATVALLMMFWISDCKSLGTDPTTTPVQVG